MKAEIVSVGTEILLGQITDTNAVEAGSVFAECGYDHFYRQTVGDNLARMQAAITLALSRSHVVLTIGGLGPTEDDITREGVAGSLGEKLIIDEFVLQELRDLFSRRKLAWVDTQIRQAQRPPCGEFIKNPNGTAPGLICRKSGKMVICLPGPRNEFIPMMRGAVREALVAFAGEGTIRSRTVRVVGIGEAALEAVVRDLMHGQAYTLAPYAKVGEVHLRITVKGTEDEVLEETLDQAEASLRELLGDRIYSTGDVTLAESILNLMVEKNVTLVTAESLTGGGLGSALTGVEGSSRVYLGGFVTYSNQLKIDLLGVPPSVLESPEQGSVSQECARAMAAGALVKLKADFAVSLTGVAGQVAFEENGRIKPNGLVYIGIASPRGVFVHEYQLIGGRETVRQRAVQTALSLLRRELLES